MFWKQKLLQMTKKNMLGTIMEVIDILPYPPQLQEEHKDPYVLDQDNNRIQQTFKN